MLRRTRSARCISATWVSYCAGLPFWISGVARQIGIGKDLSSARAETLLRYNGGQVTPLSLAGVTQMGASRAKLSEPQI